MTGASRNGRTPATRRLAVTVVRVGLALLAAAGCASHSTGPATADPPPETISGSLAGNERLLAGEEAQAHRTPGLQQRPQERPQERPDETTGLPATGSVHPAPAICTDFAGPGVLRRASVVRAVDGGLGRWLSQVRVAPVRAAGRFQGWQIARLYPDDPCFRIVDLRPGDVVTRVNGSPLERPEQANLLFQGLRSARSLDIELLRGGLARRISLGITE